jgi:hypothetical protein
MQQQQQQDRYQLCASKQESKQAAGTPGFTTGKSCTEAAVSGSEGTAADEEQVQQED